MWFMISTVWLSSVYFLFFFFQAEDGIRDLIVTGVQTCALPISFPAVDAMDLDPIRSTIALDQMAGGLALVGADFQNPLGLEARNKRIPHRNVLQDRKSVV